MDGFAGAENVTYFIKKVLRISLINIKPIVGEED